MTTLPPRVERHSRAVLAAAVAAVILVLVAAWQAGRYAEQQMRAATGKTITTVNALTHQALLTWVHENEGTVQIWAGDAKVVSLVEALLVLPHQREVLLASPLQQQLRQTLKSMMETRHYAGYFVIAPDHINLSSMRDRNIGLENLLTHQPQLLARAWAGETVISVPQISDVPLTDSDGVLRDGLPTQFVVSPIRNGTGAIIALLTFRIDPRRDFAAILAHGIWGDTGETIAFDKNARLLSESRHMPRLRARGVLTAEQSPILNATLTVPGTNGRLTRLAQQALASDEYTSGVVLDTYPDYSNEPVLGAWIWDPELGMGLATEIDEAEALRDLQPLRLTIWAMAIALAAAIVIMLYLHLGASRKLAQEKDRHRALVQNMSEGLVVHDHSGAIVTVNPQAITMLGLTEDQFLGRTSFDPRWHTLKEDGSPFPPAEHPAMVTLHTGQPQTGVVMGVFHPDDETLSWISINSRAVESEGQLRYVVVTFRDITEQRQGEQEREKLREQLQQAQKMEALGQLTSGIAHDFNNILLAIQGHAELLAMLPQDAPAEKRQRYLAQIQNAIERASTLVQQLLLFSRNKPGRPVATAAGTVVHEVAAMLQPTFPAAIRFDIEIAAGLPMIMIDQTQLHQVIANLCINARDAMAGKGTLHISLHRERVAQGQCCSCHQPVSGEWLALDIRDTGHGISSAILARIFEPFFTTKEFGKGSGMGLAMVHGIMHEHRGHIMVTSEPGHGTLFRLLFPPYSADGAL